MKTDYCGYVRVSSTRQGEQGVSLQQQRDAITIYAKRAGMNIVKWLEEQETAAKMGRPVFGELMTLLKSRKVRGVIIHKIDRSARNLRDWADMGELIDRGVEVHFANEALDLNSRGGRLSADIQAVVAADYIRNLREETKKGFYGRLKQGLFPMPAPLGYLNRGGGKAKEIDPATAPLVRRVFDLYASGLYGFDALLLEIARMRLIGRRNKAITRNGLTKILNNEFYTGLIHVAKTGETFAGVHEPLIPRSLFNRVQDILHGRVAQRPNRHDFLFRRRLTCKGCGRTLIGETHKGYNYYRCQTRDCPNTSIREDLADRHFLESFLTLQLSREEQKSAIEELRELRADEHNQQSKAIQSLELAFQSTKAREIRIIDAYVDRLIDSDTFEQRKKALLMERLEVEGQLKSWQSGKRNLADELQQVLERGNTAWITYKNGFASEKREVLDSVTSNRLLNAKTLEISMRKPFDVISSRKKCPDGSPTRDTHRTWSRLLPRILSLLKEERQRKEPVAA